jgi:hypothetical protein
LPSTPDLTDQRTTPVPFATIFSFFSSSTDKSWVENEIGSESGSLQLLLTFVIGHYRDINLLKHVLVLTPLPKGILSPSSHEAALASEIESWAWETDGTDVWVLLEVDCLVESENGNIVDEISSVVFRVDQDGDNLSLNVWVKLRLVIHVPFSKTNTEVLGREALDAMGCGEDVVRIDEAASAYVSVVSLQNGNLPWVFSKVSFPIAVDSSSGNDTPIDSIRDSFSTLTEFRGTRVASARAIEKIVVVGGGGVQILGLGAADVATRA